MIDTRNTTLNQRPKALDAIGMDFAPNILFGMVVNAKMAIPQSCHMVVS